MYKIRLISVVFTLFLIAVTFAQQVSCPALVQEAMESARTICENTGRNQVCYGHNAMQVESQPDAANFVFESVGDIVDVAYIQRILLAGLDLDAGTWGVALMRIQANIPDTIPGQNVTLLLFGNSEIRNAATSTAQQDPAESQYGPMQAFYFTTGIGNSNCAEIQDSGLLVQTPKGVGTINLLVNEINVDMGSTVYFRINSDRELSIAPVQGSARIKSGGTTRSIVAGTQIRTRLNDDYLPEGIPSEPESYAQDLTYQYLPINGLEYEIEINEGLDEEEMALFLSYGELFDDLDVDDIDDVFDYIDEYGDAEDFDLVNYLIDEMGFNGFDEDLQAFFEDDLGYDLGDYLEIDDFSDDTTPDDYGTDDYGDDTTSDDYGTDDYGDDTASDDYGD